MRVGVLASGRGTNFTALVEGLRGSSAQVVALLCNVPNAECLERAKTLGVAAEVIDHKTFATREAHDDALVAALNKHQVELVCLAGYMRLLTPRFLTAFPKRVLNVHPALLPSFPGTDGIRQAIDYGVKITGCTVHFVDDGVDTGAVIAQAAQPILETDDDTTLTDRIHADEHRLYPQVVRWYAEGRVKLVNNRVRIIEEAKR